MQSGFLSLAPPEPDAHPAARVGVAALGRIAAWLESVKEGYGPRFTPAFLQVGVEDTGDLAELAEDDAAAALEQALVNAGAKAVQLQKIRRALLELAIQQPIPIAAPTPAPTGPLAPAQGGERSAAAVTTPKRDADAEAALWRTALDLPKLPMAPLQIPRPGSVVPQSGQGYKVVRTATGPRLYFVHSIDGEVFGPGSTFAALVRLLGSCHCVALEYDDAARTCTSVPALAAMYVQRVLEDVRGRPQQSVYVAGYAFGCILAHQMALGLHRASMRTGLILLGAEVGWPSEGIESRMGGYPWLGGPFESALDVARRVGAHEFAYKESQELLVRERDERDANRLHMRTYWKHAGPSDMAYEDFMYTVTAGAKNMDVLYQAVRHFEPSETFQGPALLVLARDSPEFEVAREVNMLYCSTLRVSYSLGSHYNMLRTSYAPTTANALLTWLRSQGEAVEFRVEVPAKVSAAEVTTAPGPAKVDPAPSPVDDADLPVKVLQLINNQVPEPLSLGSSLPDAGLDSLSSSLVATQLHQAFGVQLTPGRLAEMQTVGELVDHIRGALPKGLTSTSAVPTPPAAAGAPVPGLVGLSQGDGPRIYMVHGIDGDIFSIGASYAAISPMLAPCQACALHYDDEAYRCETMTTLAALYNHRVLADARRFPGRAIFIAGYSFGCVIAHQMALQLETQGVKVGLILFDFEVTYPPEKSITRLGGYDWLGGDIEATLLMCRTVGGAAGIQWAAAAANELLEQTPQQRDAKAFMERAFGEIGRHRKGFGRREFQTFCEVGGRNMERLHTAAGQWAPGGIFRGETLLVLAPESADFHTAKDVNAKYCTSMEVVYALGSHYSILQGSLAGKAARRVLTFLRRLGHKVPEAPAVPDIPGLSTLAVGDGPRLYAVHGIEGDVFNVGSAYGALAGMLRSCNLCALAYDEEAYKCDSVPALASTYNMRVYQDVQREPGSLVVVVGYSYGCVLAHQMAYQAQQMGAQVALVLIDFEVTYPPAESAERMGGYAWLGGEIEAALLLARALGGAEGVAWSVGAALRLAGLPAGDRDAKAVRGEVFETFAAKRRGLDRDIFEALCSRGGRMMERMHTITGDWAPSGAFEGKTLLILAPESKEFHSARTVNAQYCTSMQVIEALGSHYSILQPDSAHAVAKAILDFTASLGQQQPSSEE